MEPAVAGVCSTLGALSAAFFAKQHTPSSSADRLEDLVAQWGIAFIELLCGVADRVRHVCDYADREFSRGAEREERGGLHLNSQSAGLAVAFELFEGLPIRSVGGPHETG